MSFLVSNCEEITHKSVSFHYIALKILSAHVFDSMNICMKLQTSVVSRLCRAVMMGGCTPKKLFFSSCDLDKDQRSNLSIYM